MLIVLVLLIVSAAYAGQDNATSDNAIAHENKMSAYSPNQVETISNTQEISNKHINDNKKINDNIQTDNTKTDSNTINKKSTTDKDYTDKMENTGDCCTTIIQVSKNEAVISFRRDSTGSTSNIYVENNSSFVKQYKTSGSYFFHVLVSKDGWMVGTGGTDNSNVNRLIESRALSMIKSNKITTSDLNYIGNLHRQLGIGHFIIKAPDGRYGSEVFRNGAKIYTGTLKNGDYIICPNSKVYYRTGNCLNDLKTSGPVYVSRLITLKDPYGINRRNIMTYHFKRNQTTSNINFYAGNDNGAYVGRSTAYLRDNIVTKTKKIAAGRLPTSVGGLYIDTYTYILNASYKPKVDFILTTSDMMTKMGNNITFTANLKIDDMNVNTGYVIFKLNGITIKDKNNRTVKAYLKNGVASIVFTMPDGWSAKAVKLTSVYSKSNYGRIENKTYFNLTRPDTHMQLVNRTFNTRLIRLTGVLLDEHNHNVLGENIFAVKVSGLTLKTNNGDVMLFKVVNGTIDITVTLPDYYKSGNHTVILSTGTRGAYNACRGTCVLSLQLM